MNIGIESNLFFDPYKSINKVNNHKSDKALKLKLMEGRDDFDTYEGIHLPGYMNKIHSINSLEFSTKKHYKWIII